MLTRSPRDRSRSPHNGFDVSASAAATDDAPTSSESSSKAKRENESQQRTRSLKAFVQALLNESTSTPTDEQVKALETACIDEYRDLSSDRIRRVIRSALKVRKPQSSFLHQDLSSTLSAASDRFNACDSSSSSSRKKSRSSSTSKSELIPSPTSTLSAFDADFLRHAFSQQFRPSLDLSTYFPATGASNGASASSSLFRPNFTPSTFLQSLTNTAPLAPPPPPPPPPPLPSPLVSSHTHTNGTNDTSMSKLSKQVKLSTAEISSMKVLVNAYREAAAYLCRSADELEQLI